MFGFQPQGFIWFVVAIVKQLWQIFKYLKILWHKFLENHIIRKYKFFSLESCSSLAGGQSAWLMLTNHATFYKRSLLSFNLVSHLQTWSSCQYYQLSLHNQVAYLHPCCHICNSHSMTNVSVFTLCWSTQAEPGQQDSQKRLPLQTLSQCETVPLLSISSLTNLTSEKAFGVWATFLLNM